jgi:hypothetical protein
MHCEYFNARATADPLDELGVEEPAPDGFDDAFGDPPPQAANPNPRAARTASSAAQRQRRRLPDASGDFCSASLACMSLPFVS